MKIDSHQHFWNYSPAEYGWITDALSVLKRDFTPNDLGIELTKKDYRGSIAVQARQSLAENDFLLDMANNHEQVLGVVGWVDLKSSDLIKQLDKYAAQEQFVGVRHIVQDEKDPEFIIQKKFIEGVKQLTAYNLTYDILIYEKQLRITEEFVKQLPNHKLVVDHMAKPNIKAKSFEEWKKGIEILAQYEQVSCKVSGLVTEADWQHWSKADFTPYLEIVLEAFGPDRLMIGSDWPVCTLAADYEKAIGISEDFFSSLSNHEQNKILGENALNFYNIKR